MPVSANTLFHFTPKEILKAILASSKFFPSYSEEHFENIVPDKNIHSILFIPLVSFCDLTITQLARDSKHTEHYSKYGIGLKKEWGNDNGISPITYVHRNSQPAKQIITLYNLTDAPAKEDSDKILNVLIKRQMTDSFKYLKPYEGNWHKGKPSKETITYYNEREWRFCPSIDDFEILFEKELKKHYKTNITKHIERRNKSLQKFSSVKFTPDVIKYIIVNKENEVEEFAEWIEKNIPTKDQSKLTPKLISFEKIENDF